MHGGPTPGPGPEPEACRYRPRPWMALFASDSPLALVGPTPPSDITPSPCLILSICHSTCRSVTRRKPKSSPRADSPVHAARTGNRFLNHAFHVLLSGPSSSQEVDDVKVVLVAGVFIHLLGRIDPGPGNPGGPGFCPRRRILDREFVIDRVGVDARKALGDVVGRGVCF